MSKFTSIMFAISLVAILGWAGNAFAITGTSDTINPKATVNIISPISVKAADAGMAFGNLVKPSAPGSHKSVAKTAAFTVTAGGATFAATATIGAKDGCTQDGNTGATSGDGVNLAVTGKLVGTTLTATGNVTVTDKAIPGKHTCSYTVTANYVAS